MIVQDLSLLEVLDNYGWFGKIKQAITDRGTQFYANKKNKNEESQSRFEALLLEKEIQHIKARYLNVIDQRLKDIIDTFF